MPTVLVNAGILTPFPYVAPKPDISAVTAKEPLLDLWVYYNSIAAKLQERIMCSCIQDQIMLSHGTQSDQTDASVHWTTQKADRIYSPVFQHQYSMQTYS
jgi:hypothetical protein